VFTTEAALEVVAELAGMSSDQIDVMVEGDILSIRGTRERPEALHVRSFYEARIPFGPFLAEVAIPFEIEWEKTTADYSNGLLRVSLPRRPARTVTVRQVEVLDEEESEYR
jgi:HSP20 family protein